MVNINFCVGGGCKSNPGPVYMAGVWIHLSVWRKAHKRLFDFYVHNRATHVTTKAFSDATETAVGSSNSLPTFHFAPFFFFSTRFSSWFSIRTSIDDTSTVNPLPLTMAIQIRIMVLGFLWSDSKRKINGLWIDLLNRFEGYIWREKQSNWFLIHTTTMFTVLKAVALRLWMWNISLTLESPKTMTGQQAKHSMYIVFAHTVVRRPCQPISLSTENHIYHVCDHSWHLRAGPRLWRRIEPKAAYRICPSALPVPRRHRPGQTDTWDQISSVSCDLLL